MRRSFIISAKRSAVAPINGAFAALEPHELAAPVISALLKDCGIDTEIVDEVIVGNALGAGGNPARLCALAAGLPETVAGLTLDRQCVSGLDALLVADAYVRSGQADIVIAGGAESYSRRPLRSRTFADGREPQPYDQAAFTPWADRDPNMHDAAQALAAECGLSRKIQDEWAVQSHAKARNARARLSSEIVEIQNLKEDRFTRPLSDKAAARARAIIGTVTPANTSVAADGAAFCLVVSETVAQNFGEKAVEILGGKTLGGRPDMPGLAPVGAIRTVLSAAKLEVKDIVVAEVMEAYAAQAIACINEIGLSSHCVNRGGGSLARGHPIGASGAINAVRLYHELRSTGGLGLAAIAAAGGLGTALLLKR